MKNLVTIIFCFFSVIVWSQVDTTAYNQYSKIIKHDDSELKGIILKNDDREILLKVESVNIVIPKGEIKKIESIDYVAVKGDGSLWPRNLLASRYTLSTNSIPIKKGEGYFRIMPIGVDFHLPINNYWSIGGMNSWIGAPVFISSKISHSLRDNVHVSTGLIYGNLTYLFNTLHQWPFNFTYGGGMGFGNITFGNENDNISIGVGYGLFHHPEGADYSAVFTMTSPKHVYFYEMAKFSAGGMTRLGEKSMLVVDAMCLLVSSGNQIMTTCY